MRLILQNIERFVGQLDERLALIIDPMLATGGSLIATIDMLKRNGCTHVRAIVLVAALWLAIGWYARRWLQRRGRGSGGG